MNTRLPFRFAAACLLIGAGPLGTAQSSTFVQSAYVKASNPNERDLFGESVAVSGNTIVVGARGEDSHGTGVNSGTQASNNESSSGVNGGGQASNSMPYAGAAYVFDRSAIGSRYCSPAVPNSTGSPASLAALGSDAVTKNDVSLRCDHLSRHLFGVFLTGRMQGLIVSPAGSQGNLCLGGAFGHFAAPGQIQNSDATGTIELALNVQRFPTPTGSVSVQVGETWSFQCWYRDDAGGVPTSNFSDGVGVTFR